MADNDASHPLWKRIDEHRKALEDHSTRLSVVEREQMRQDARQEELMQRIIAGEERDQIHKTKVNDVLMQLSAQLSELRGSSQALKWIIPISITVIIAGVSAAVYLIERT